jgi:hypothetical protein
VALLAALLFGGAVLLLGRGASSSGRIVGGALLGLPFGLFVGLTLVLLGVIPLASGLVNAPARARWRGRCTVDLVAYPGSDSSVSSGQTSS